MRDEHFDLGYHCREIALPPPGSLDQLSEQVARIYSRRLDRARPLWELYLIHGLADDNVFPLHTLRLSQALLAAGRPHEVLLLAEEDEVPALRELFTGTGT